MIAPSPSRVIALLVAAALLAGCAGGPPATPQFFVIDPGRPPSLRSVRAADAPSVAVSFVNVAAPFAGNGFVYQVTEHGWETDPYNQFLVSPAGMTTALLRDWLRRSDLFASVAEPGDAGGQDLLVSADLLELYGDFRNPFDPRSVVALEVQVLRRTDRGLVVVLRRKYEQATPVTARTPEALITSWNEGMRVALNRMLRDLAAAR